MDTNNAVVATVAIVVVGRWSRDESLDVSVVVGGMFLAIILSLMSQTNAKFASRFAVLILVIAMFTYVPAIAYKAGLTKVPPPIWGPKLKIPKKARGNTGGRKK